jgi:hypothetical protein
MQTHTLTAEQVAETLRLMAELRGHMAALAAREEWRHRILRAAPGVLVEPEAMAGVAVRAALADLVALEVQFRSLLTPSIAMEVPRPSET